MAFKLTKQEIARRDGFVTDLRSAAGAVQDAVSAYNAALEALAAPVNEALAAYNETLAEARGFAEDIASEADSDFDSKSEKWQDSEKGIEAAEFRDAWQQLELDDIDLALATEVVFDEPDHADNLEQVIDHAGEG